ncbi:MAG: tetratricopeptide repeat protein [Acidobacteria bacterium]|nr:tetratricopeptide repeat protein [Acidobacteriota bacterium]
MSGIKILFHRNKLRIAFISALWIGFPLFLAGQSKKAPSWEQIRGIAEAQHEIVLLHIRNQEYEKVLPSYKKIFALEFPTERLNLLVDSTKIVVDSLIHQGQYVLAHEVIDEALKSIAVNRHKASLYREKAYICSRQGNSEEALRFFQKAIELEQSVP